MLLLVATLIRASAEASWLLLDLVTLRMTFSFRAAPYACLFAAIVIFVSVVVFFYRESYIDGEQHRLRFAAILALFVLSMLVLIFSRSVRSIILG